jgi:uncharacterized membrane protein YkgB
MVAILVPIASFLMIGIIWVSFIYFRSKEKQMMIEKGMTQEQMMELLKSKRNPYTILKIGVIAIFFGLGLGLGMLIKVYSGVEEWLPFLIITFTGVGFVAAFLVSKKFEQNGIK